MGGRGSRERDSDPRRTPPPDARRDWGADGEEGEPLAWGDLTHGRIVVMTPPGCDPADPAHRARGIVRWGGGGG
eukprot:gene1372-9434_t